MTKRPAFMFYPADWRKDPGLRVCSIAARGLWIDMLALMHEAEPYGHLIVNGAAVTGAQLARLVGESGPLVTRLLAELESHNVFSRTDAGVMYSRRMVADEQKRESQAIAGRKGGSPSLGIEYNVPGYVYAMQRSSDGAVKIGISTTPAKRLYRVRQQFPTCTVELIGSAYTDNMGVAEAALHTQFANQVIGGAGEWFALDDDDLDSLLTRLKVTDKANDKVKGKGKQKGEAPSSVAVAVAVTGSNSSASPLAAADGEHSSPVTWLTPYLAAWQAQYDGPMPVEPNVQALRWLEGKHGVDETVRRWTIYLAATRAEFAAAAKLKSGWGQWAAAPAAKGGNGANGAAPIRGRVLLDIMRRYDLFAYNGNNEEYEAKLVAASQDPAAGATFRDEARLVKPWKGIAGDSDHFKAVEIEQRLRTTVAA